MTGMTWIVLGVIVFIALVIVVDGVRQRRIRATRSIDLRGLITARFVADGPAILTSALRESLARAPSTERGPLRAARRPARCRRLPAAAPRGVRAEGVPTAAGATTTRCSLAPIASSTTNS